MAFSKDELDHLQTMMTTTIIDVVGPMFEQQNEEIAGLRQDVDGLRQDVDGLRQDVDGLRQDVDGLRQDVDGLRQEFDDFRVKTERHFDSIEQRLRELNDKIDDQTTTLKERMEYMSEDIDLLSRLATKLDSRNQAERDFARMTLDHQVPILYRQLQIVAKKAGVKLPL